MDLIIPITFIIICIMIVIYKLFEGVPFEDWIWPIIALMWCVISIIF